MKAFLCQENKLYSAGRAFFYNILIFKSLKFWNIEYLTPYISFINLQILV